MLETLKDKVGEWLRGGPQDDVVLSSRVRMARNIAGYPFLSRISDQEAARVEEILRNKIVACELHPELSYHRLDELDELSLQLLVERHLIGRDHAEADWVRGVAFCPDERMSLMVNEEDHLRLQIIRGGLRLGEAFGRVDEVDDALAEFIPFSFSARYGYLTACPTNVGTGMRASVMVHVPGLVMAQEMDRLVGLARDSGLALRGLYGEGTHGSADLYQISNQATLGVSEQQVVETVAEAVGRVIDMERETRQRLLGQHPERVADRVEQCLELLREAEMISSEEALRLLSMVRLGIHLELVSELDIPTLNQVFLLTLPAHLQTMEGRKLDRKKRCHLRAAYLRERLKN